MGGTDDLSLFEQGIEAHLETVRAMRRHLPLLKRMADRLLEALAGGGRIYVCGNGGSAADAQHIAAELLGRFKRDRKALPAIALTTDTSVLTALVNDLGADAVFRRQVEGLVGERDVLWLLSVSGASPNVLAAADAGRDCGATVVAFTSSRGAALADRADLCFMADAADSDRVQEMHELGYHLICDYIERAVSDE